jgi:hypothetical protein
LEPVERWTQLVRPLSGQVSLDHLLTWREV